MKHEIDRVMDAARAIMRDGGRGVALTLLRTSGSTYRRAGARAVLDERGIACGLVSGGCIERDLAERMHEWLAAFEPRVVTYDSTSDADVIFGSGLGCRGTLDLLVEPFDADHPPSIDAFRWNGRTPVVWTTRLGDRELLVEAIRPPRAVAVFGDGSDVEPVLRLAEELGWQTTRFAASQREFDCCSFDAAVVMTHNFLHDVELLELLLPSAIPYVGVLGPKRRGAELGASLTDSARAHIGRLRSPIGLALGGDTPEEIALSIVAEIQSVLHGRDARALAGRDAPIHEPRVLVA
jgi:xanthine/CO dehydrogenase XdhC/CoxF family maturation factor